MTTLLQLVEESYALKQVDTGMLQCMIGYDEVKNFRSSMDATALRFATFAVANLRVIGSTLTHQRSAAAQIANDCA